MSPKYQFPHVRISQDVGTTKKYYAVDLDRKTVYAAGADGQITQEGAVTHAAERGEVLRAAQDLRWNFPRMTPGVRTHLKDSAFASGGVINDREWKRFQQRSEPIPAQRPPLALHIDFMDRRGTGYITIPDMVGGWSAVGTKPLMAPVKAVLTALVFGSKNPCRHFLQVNTDKLPRPKGSSGLFLPDGTVNPELAQKMLAHLAPREITDGTRPLEDDGKAFVPTWLSEAEFMERLTTEIGHPLGKIPARQYKTLFDACARLNQNGERKINQEQFRWFLEGNLNDYVASKADRRGNAPIQTYYRKLFQENQRMKDGLADGVRAAPDDVLLNHLAVLRPEVTTG